MSLPSLMIPETSFTKLSLASSKLLSKKYLALIGKLLVISKAFNASFV